MDDDHEDLAQRIERVNRLKTQTAENTRALREEAQRLAEQMRRHRDELQVIRTQLRKTCAPSKDGGATAETNS